MCIRDSIRVRDFNGVGVELGFERHALRRGAQYDGVSVEEVVAERYGVVFELSLIHI